MAEAARSNPSVSDDFFPQYSIDIFADYPPRAKLKHCEHEVAGMTDRLHGIREAAARIGVSPWTARRLIRRGDLRSVRVGRRVLVAESEILQVIRRGCGAKAGSLDSSIKSSN
jgi:excisionase family DNA binding protein